MEYDIEKILYTFEDDYNPSSMVPGPRNSFSGGGLALARMLLKNLNKTGPVKGLEEKLIKKFRSEGMDLLEAIKKAQVESTTIKNNAKNKILDDAMKETDITSDDYVELIDQKIKIIEPEYYRDIKRWSNDRPDLADKTRALFYPDWAEAKYGENYMGVLQNRQAKAIRENIDPNVKEPLSPSDQMVSDIDDMNTANIDELFGRKKNAEGGFQQLVQPNADGSRPGYAGDDFVNLNDIKKYNKNLLDKSIIVSTAPGRTGANQADPVTLRNIFNVVEKTKDGNVLINNFKKNPTSENFLKLRTRRKNRLAFEKEQALPAEQKAELRKKQLIAEKKWRASGKGQSYYNELLAKDGIFPARTAQERVWRDIYRASKQSKENSRFKIKYPKNIEIDPETNLPKKVKAKSGKYYIPWDRYYKKVSFYDTETKSTIKFGNMREWMKNNVKNGGKKYDNAIQNYNLRQNIADFDVDGKSLGAVAKEKKTGLYAKKLTTPAAVNHRSGLNNFWDTEITTSTGNSQLNDKVQSRISAYKNASNPNIKNRIMKQMKAEINKIQGGATLVVDGETIGKKPTLKKVSNALAKELDVDLLKLASTVTDQCRIGNAVGGRIGFKTAGSVDCLSIGKKTAKDLMEKGLKNGFPKNQQGDLARKILSSGKFLKDAVSLRGLFGPAALAFTVAAEAGIVGYDMLSSGKSFREAVGDSVFNYALGDKTKIDSEEEFIKRLKNISGSPGQGFRGFTDEDINKMLVFKSKLKDMETGFSNYSDLININKKIEENTKNQQVNPELFPDQAFQLEAEKDRIQADIRDYNKVGTPRNVTDYMYSDKATEGGDALARGTLLAKESQLLDAYRSSPKGIENLKKDLIDTRFNLEQMYNPPKLTKFGQAFIDATPGEQSYFMGRTDFMEGGIASLNVNKK